MGFLREIRIAEAQHLLRNTDLAVSDIALKAGIPCRIRVSPVQYREEEKE